MDLLVALVLFAGLLLVGYVVGSQRERAHYASIRERERKLIESRFPIVTFRTAPPSWRVESGVLVAGSVVVALDYFKSFVARLRGFVGGRVTSYESLLDRARREALLRMHEAAVAAGCHAIVNLRFETAEIGGDGSSRRGGGGTGGVEIIAFGTGVRITQ